MREMNEMNKTSKAKNIQISLTAFLTIESIWDKIDISQFSLWQRQEYKKVSQELKDKRKAMSRREDYQKMKQATSEAEKQKYQERYKRQAL